MKSINIFFCRIAHLLSRALWIWLKMITQNRHQKYKFIEYNYFLPSTWGLDNDPVNDSKKLRIKLMRRTKLYRVLNTNGSSYLGQTATPTDSQQKKEKKGKDKLPNCGLCVPTEHRVKLRFIENRDKYMDLARELNKLWNMKAMVIPVVIYVLSTVTKRFVLGQEVLEIIWRVKTIQTTALLWSARTLRRVRETWGGHHHVVLKALIPLTRYHDCSLSYITFDKMALSVR